MIELDEATLAALRAVPHFTLDRVARWDLGKLLTHYICRYVEMVDLYRPLASVRSIADIGTGYGWLAIAWALTTDATIIAVDRDAARLAAARKLARILGVERCIDWRVGELGRLPVADREADVTFCIEVIEHTGRSPELLADLSRTSRDLLVISTPNRHFPWLKHDAMLPFCHWLPKRGRDVYASAFGRIEMQENSRFWSASEIARGLPEFGRVSGFMEFPDFASYRRAAAIADRELSRLTGVRRLAMERYFRLASALGRRSIYALPNLGATYRRGELRPAPSSTVRDPARAGYGRG